MKTHKTRFTLSASTIFALLAIILSIYGLITYASETGCLSVLAKDQDPMTWDRITFLTNQERKNKGLMPLRESQILKKTANKKACDMVNRNYFDHQDPDGRRSWDLLMLEGYKNKYVAENLARGFNTDEERIESWMHSETHRKNIMSSIYQEIGIGRCGKYVVQHFGGK